MPANNRVAVPMEISLRVMNFKGLDCFEELTEAAVQVELVQVELVQVELVQVELVQVELVQGWPVPWIRALKWVVLFFRAPTVSGLAQSAARWRPDASF